MTGELIYEAKKNNKMGNKLCKFIFLTFLCVKTKQNFINMQSIIRQSIRKLKKMISYDK